MSEVVEWITDKEKVEITSTGGKQSEIEGMPTLVPAYALRAVAATMKRGSKYGLNNWTLIPVQATEHAEGEVDSGELDHAIQHYLNFMTEAEDPMEELTHFTARAMMALDQFIRENNINLAEFKG